MTEPHDPTARIELGPLAPDAAESERVIGAVMSRLGARPQARPVTSDVLEIVGRHLSPSWIAAAAAIAIAGSAALIANSDSTTASGTVDTAARGSADALVATWANRQHVPTNGELLLAFQGYGR